MSHESFFATGSCPHPDCGALVSLGKKFCKACGRPIQGVSATTAPAAGEPAEPPSGLVVQTVPQPTADSPGFQDHYPQAVPPNLPPLIEEPPSSPDTQQQVRQETPQPLGAVDRAQSNILSPPPGSLLPLGEVTLSWQPSHFPSFFSLAANGVVVVQVNVTNLSSLTVRGFSADGNQILARLWEQCDGRWRFTDAVYYESRQHLGVGAA